MDNQGVLAVISGFSGAGKGTLMRALLERYDNYALSISATTRAPREGEVDGREYFFKTREEFEQMIEHDELVEYAQYVGNYYGTPKEYVFSNLKAGKDVLLEIEIQGALKIKKKFRRQFSFLSRRRVPGSLETGWQVVEPRHLRRLPHGFREQRRSPSRWMTTISFW